VLFVGVCILNTIRHSSALLFIIINHHYAVEFTWAVRLASPLKYRWNWHNLPVHQKDRACSRCAPSLVHCKVFRGDTGITIQVNTPALTLNYLWPPTFAQPLLCKPHIMLLPHFRSASSIHNFLIGSRLYCDLASDSVILSGLIWPVYRLSPDWLQNHEIA